MKKILLAGIIVVICSLTVINVYAKSLRGQTLRANTDVVAILKYDTVAKFHTSVWVTYMNESRIEVENVVQRKNSAGNFVNRGWFYPVIDHINDDYQSNFNLVTTADTRSIWTNVTSGTTIKGDFYINDGYYS